MSLRGGVPIVRRVAPDTTGAAVGFTTHLGHLIARNKHATVVTRMYFTKADFDSNANYVELPVAAAVTPHGHWEGPVETGGGTLNADVWLKAIGGTGDVELVGFQKR